MTEALLFSVVIPTYNRAGIILKTLESVFAQTYRHHEIIVVDDCSTDNTSQLLQPLLDSGRIRLITHEKNCERAQSRNTGMDQAKGDFLTFLDSDDLMYSSNLADAAAYVRQYPGIKVFQNRYELVDENNNVLSQYSLPPLDDHVKAITAGNFMACIGDFIHRDVYEKYRFDTSPELNVSEDWLFWLHVLADHTPGRIEKVNNGVVFHKDRSVNHLDLQTLHRARQYLIQTIASDSHLSTVYGKYLKRLEAGALLYASTVANQGRRHGTALRYLMRAASLDVRSITSINFLKALGIAVLRVNKGY